MIIIREVYDIEQNFIYSSLWGYWWSGYYTIKLFKNNKKKHDLLIYCLDNSNDMFDFLKKKSLKQKIR